MREYIQATPGTRGGKPRLAGTRITVADVVLMHRRMGRALEEIAGTYDLPLPAVYAAMAYYYDHKVEIDDSLDRDEEVVEALRQNSPSCLRERLKTLLVDDRIRFHLIHEVLSPGEMTGQIEYI
jgi:uncharacterized protein (DUF433 family)